MASPPRPGSTPNASFGRWSYHHATARWSVDADLLALLDAGSEDPHDVEVLIARMPDSDQERIRDALREAIETGGSLAGQFQTRTVSRGLVVLGVVADTVRGPDGTPVELRGYSTDLTEEVRQATRAAVDAATRHRRAIEQVKGALMVTYRIDEVTAFALLRQQSNVHNIKLNVLSEHVARVMAAGREGGGRAPMMELVEQTALGLSRQLEGDPGSERSEPPA